MATPPLNPVTWPVGETVATDVVPMLQTPPEEPSVNATESPTQTEVEPTMIPALGNGFTVITLDVAQPPAASVYVIVSAPNPMPVTNPAGLTDAMLDELVLHTPEPPSV